MQNIKGCILCRTPFMMGQTLFPFRLFHGKTEQENGGNRGE